MHTKEISLGGEKPTNTRLLGSSGRQCASLKTKEGWESRTSTISILHCLPNGSGTYSIMVESYGQGFWNQSMEDGGALMRHQMIVMLRYGGEI